MNGSAVVLCSGGMDSVLSACVCIEQGFAPYLTHIDYGQRTADAERAAINACCRFFNWHKPILLDIKNIGRFGSGSLVSSNHLDDSVFPQRNLTIVAVGSVVACSIGSDRIVMGITSAMNPEFYDCSESYIESMESTLSLSEPPIVLMTPLAKLDKVAVGRECLRCGVPVDLTFSCNVGPDTHCQKCTSCMDRAIAMGAMC